MGKNKIDKAIQKRREGELTLDPTQDLARNLAQNPEQALRQGLPRIKQLKKSHLKSLIPYPAESANKYTRGKLVAVGGSAKYPGSIIMGSRAAYRMGAGYVEVVCAPETISAVNMSNPEAVAAKWNGWNLRSSHLDSTPVPHHPMACLVGSGMTGDTSRERDLILDILIHCNYPVIADGGAFNVLASDDGLRAAAHRKDKNLSLILTPHFGEAARLWKAVGAALPSDMQKLNDQACAKIAFDLASVYNATVLLKGAKSYIASQSDAKVWCMSHGTAALAKAGTGDVLAGMVGALAAQGLDAVAAAQLASWLHAECGRLASDKYGEIGVCATDLPNFIGKAIANVYA